MAFIPPFRFYHFHDRVKEKEEEEEGGKVKLPQQVGPSLDVGERRTVRRTGFLARPIYTGNACLCHPVGSHLLCPGQLPAKRGAAKRGEARRDRGKAIESATELIAARGHGAGTSKERKRRNTERYTEREQKERTRSGRRRVPLGYRRKRNIQCNGGRCWR